MKCRLIDMRNKEVIHMKTGIRIGCVSDIEIDTINAKLLSVVIYGRLKWFGLLGRENDIIIKWEDIEVIGEDIILVKHNIGPPHKKRRFNELRKFWSG